MADAPEGKPDSGGEPNLELPSLSLGLRRRKKKRSRQDTAESAAPVADPVEARTSDPHASPRDSDEASGLPRDEPAISPTDRAVPPPPPGSLAVPPPPPTAAADRIPPPPVPVEEPAAEEPGAEETIALHPSATAPDDDEPAGDEPAAPEPVADDAGTARERRPRFRAPVLAGNIAAPLTGVVCGLVAVGLAALASEGCASVRGVGGCGTFGFFALLAILAIAVILGSLLLRLCRVPDPTSTSFLGSGLVAVFVMLFLLDSIGSIWMVLVIPVLGAAAFWLSWWVTSTYVEESSD